ncbi:MAG TPA: phage tail assembly chaperone [Rhizomicrobium sp.]|nr:phage tail assembly chaperone [Rhizomicrobium sp.]
MGIAPDVFWAMSLPEWRAAVDGFAMKKGARRNVPLSRGELQTMMTMFPD